MSEIPPLVVHVIGPDVSRGRLLAARLICAARLETEQKVLLVGQAARHVKWPGALKVHAPFDLPRLGTRRIKHLLKGMNGERGGGNSAALHVWSPQALRWALPVCAAHKLLIELETASAVSDLPADVPAGAGYVCSTARAHECLRKRGVPAERCWLIRDAVDFAALENAPRAALRARLGIADDEKAIAVLPPLTRAAGAEYATWGALLLEKARSDVRLIVPGRAVENRQIRYLVRSCRHEHVVRLAEDLSLAELVAAADVATYLPIADAPVTGLAWAMAGGRPIVATAVPVVTELLEDKRSAWLCRPRDPHDAARYMLKALEQPETSARLAAAAREQATLLFSWQTALEGYRRAYAALAGRPSRVAMAVVAPGVL